MNLKKFLVASCFMLQFSMMLHADQAAWNAAFLAFGGGSNLTTAIQSIKANSESPTSALSVANSLKTPEGQAVGHFVAANKKTLFASTYTDTDVQNALKGIFTTGSTSSTPTTPTTPTISSIQLSDTTNWAAAFAAFTGGAAAVYNKTVPATMPSSITSTSAAYGDARVIVQYLSVPGAGITTNVTNPTDLINLNTAFAANNAIPKQLSDTTNWTAAFAAFTGGAVAVYNKTVSSTMPASISSTSPTYGDARVIVQYLSVPGAGITTNVTNPTDLINLNTAFAANNAIPKQLSDTTNWTAAFAAFTGGAVAVYNKTVSATMPVSITSTSAAYGDARVILQYLSMPGASVTTGVTNPTDIINLNNAFLANNAIPKQLSDTTNWVAAFAAFTGGAVAVYNKTAPATMPASISSTSPTYGDAQVIVQYLSIPGVGVTTNITNPTDITNLNNAFITNNAIPQQLSDTTNWAAAFAAFPGGALAVYEKMTPAIMPPSINSTSPACNNAWVILEYLSVPGMGITTGVSNLTDVINLNNAFVAAGVSKPLSDTTNWNQAFSAFSNFTADVNTAKSAVFNKIVPKTMPSSITPTSPEYGNAQVILEYLSVPGIGVMSGITSPIDIINLHNAFLAPAQNIGVILNNSPQGLYLRFDRAGDKKDNNSLISPNKRPIFVNQVLPIDADALYLTAYPVDHILWQKPITSTSSYVIDANYAVTPISNSSYTITNYTSKALIFAFYGTIGGVANSPINPLLISINPNQSCPIMPGAVSVAVRTDGSSYGAQQAIAANSSYIIGANLKMN